jgi:predicted metal-dependent hydrolase
MSDRSAPDYLSAYPPALVARVHQLIEQQRFAPWLLQRYPQAHGIRTDRALYEHVQALKAAHLRTAVPLGKVCFDSRIHAVRNALGTHAAISRVFRDLPYEFLRMIVVHELAHLRQPDHDKAFYQLCLHLEPQYHQYEFDLRAYLTHRDRGGPALWSARPEPDGAGA